MTRHSNSGKNISGSGVAATKVIHFAACLILLCVICPPAPAQRGDLPRADFRAGDKHADSRPDGGKTCLPRNRRL